MMTLFKEKSYFVDSEIVSTPVVVETAPNFVKKNETGEILNKMNKNNARGDEHVAFHGVFKNSDGTPVGFQCKCGSCHLIIEELPLWSISIPRETMIKIKNRKLGFEIIDGKIFFFDLTPKV